MYVGGGVEVAGLEVKGSRRWSRRWAQLLCATGSLVRAWKWEFFGLIFCLAVCAPAVWSAPSVITKKLIARKIS